MSPMDQKLSSEAMRRIRLSGRPAILRHRPAASSSVAWTVTRRRLVSMPKSFEIERQAVLDRPLLEIVAEGEIPQHLEEGVVARGIADVVQVVVLAPGAHALLRGGGAGAGGVLRAGEDVLERDHAGVDEHQRRIAARDQRRRRQDGVVVRGEIVEELSADLVQTGHGRPLPSRDAGDKGRGAQGLEPQRHGGTETSSLVHQPLYALFQNRNVEVDEETELAA